MDPQTEELGDFLSYVWSDTEGFVYLPIHHAPFGDTDWEKRFFVWPRQKAQVIRYVLKWTAIGDDVFYAPPIYKQTRPIKEDVLGSWVLWVDFDGNAPETWDGEVPPPTLRLQSSIPGHEHCYWRLKEFLSDTSMLEDRNRALAYTTHADMSGWDASQILRPVGTMNHKRGKPVTILEWDR